MKKIIKIITVTLTLAFLLCGCGLSKPKSYATVEEFYNNNKLVMNGATKILKMYCGDDMDFKVEYEDNDIITTLIFEDFDSSNNMEKAVKDYLYKEKEDFLSFASSMKELTKIDDECVLVVKVTNENGEEIAQMDFCSDGTTSEDNNYADASDSESGSTSDSGYTKDFYTEDSDNDNSEDSYADYSTEDGSNTQDQGMSSIDEAICNMQYTMDVDGNTILLIYTIDQPNSQEVVDRLNEFFIAAEEQITQNNSSLKTLADDGFNMLHISVKNMSDEILYEKDIPLDANSL